jgi:glycosyltransferase involved in cell wall biosynthesis
MNRPAPRNGNRLARDAIVMSGWTWEAFNVPERVALAFAHLGARVLYCENPVSFFRDQGHARQEVERGIYRTGLEFLGHRLNRIPVFFPHLQSKLLSTQILRNVDDLELTDPLFVYPHGNFASLCAEFKKKGFFLVHVCMDYPEDGQERLIELSDLTLNIPKSLYGNLKATYGDKIKMIPQVRRSVDSENPEAEVSPDTTELAGIPRPILGYAGPANGRLDLRILHEALTDHPEWQFLHFGSSRCLNLKNVHVLPWQTQEKFRTVVTKLDVGLMPYRRDDNRDLHCMPLKLLDYFAHGKPVVSTPILNLREFSDTIYFGDDADELCRAIQLALDEPTDSPLKSKRAAIARENSIEALADVLAEVLEPCRETSNAGM